MTQDLSRQNAATIAMTLTRIAGTAAIALTMLLGICAAIQPAAAQIVAPVPVAQVVELAVASSKSAPLGLQATPVIFKKHGGFRGRSYKGGHRFGGYGSVGVKKFGHSGVAIKKHGTRNHGFHGKSFQSHGFYGYRGFRRY